MRATCAPASGTKWTRGRVVTRVGVRPSQSTINVCLSNRLVHRHVQIFVRGRPIRRLLWLLGSRLCLLKVETRAHATHAPTHAHARTPHRFCEITQCVNPCRRSSDNGSSSTVPEVHTIREGLDRWAWVRELQHGTNRIAQNAHCSLWAKMRARSLTDSPSLHGIKGESTFQR